MSVKIQIYFNAREDKTYAIGELTGNGAVVVTDAISGGLREVVINPSAEAYAAILKHKKAEGYLYLITLDVPEDHALAAVTLARDVYLQTVEEAIQDISEECYLPVIEQIARSGNFVHEGTLRAREWLEDNPRSGMPLFPCPAPVLTGGRGCYF